MYTGFVKNITPLQRAINELIACREIRASHPDNAYWAKREAHAKVDAIKEQIAQKRAELEQLYDELRQALAEREQS